MLTTLDLDYVQHLERGYCENHPDVIAQTKEQVVDRAVKQLLTALQANGFELDGNILKRGNGWLQYDATSSAWQYSNDAGVTWLPMTQGVLDHTGLQNIGTNTHAQIDTHLANIAIHSPLIGEIRMLSLETIPTGWLLCDGQTILRSSALGVLYAALGYPYGAGNGTTTCNIPDLLWRFPFGASAIDEVGLQGGVEGATLPDALNNAPHNHDIAINYASAAGTANTFVRGGASEGTLTFTSSDTGGDKDHENLPPYLTLNFIVYVGV